eukprot:scaffold218495_cov31-Tisochrysis_lutea.AAC.1
MVDTEVAGRAVAARLAALACARGRCVHTRDSSEVGNLIDGVLRRQLEERLEDVVRHQDGVPTKEVSKELENEVDQLANSFVVQPNDGRRDGLDVVQDCGHHRTFNRGDEVVDAGIVQCYVNDCLCARCKEAVQVANVVESGRAL